MRKTSLPLVTDINYEITLIGSDGWYEWLNSIKSFRYEPKQYGRTLRCDITVRRVNNYWKAYRKVNNKLRSYYLGKTSELDYERLQLAVDELSLSDILYWRNKLEKKARRRTKVNILIDLQEENKKLRDEIEKLNMELAKFLVNR